MSEPTELASAELTVLDIPQLRDLVEELFDVKHKWFSIGLRLNIPDDALEGIDKTCKDDLDTALRRMLQEWISREQPAWVTVVEALRSRSVRADVLAANLHERFIGTVQRSLPATRRRQQSIMPNDRQQLVQYTPESALHRTVVLQQEEIPGEEVREAIMHLYEEFEELRLDVYHYLEMTLPNPKHFAVFVSCRMPSWKKKRPNQSQVEGVDKTGIEFYQMFCAVSQYIDWYNYELLDRIVQRYGNPQLKGRMEKYRTKMVEFESCTSADKLKNIEFAKPLEDSVAIIARLPDHHCNQFMGSDMRGIKHQYTSAAGLDNAALRTHMINESSVEIIFLVPISLAPHLMMSSLTVSPLLTSQDPLPDIHERCVYDMHAEEVFRLMGRTVTPPAPRRVSSASHKQQVQPSGSPLFRYYS
jgi:hypothetical protein